MYVYNLCTVCCMLYVMYVKYSNVGAPKNIILWGTGSELFLSYGIMVSLRFNKNMFSSSHHASCQTSPYPTPLNSQPAPSTHWKLAGHKQSNDFLCKRQSNQYRGVHKSHRWRPSGFTCHHRAPARLLREKSTSTRPVGRERKKKQYGIIYLQKVGRKSTDVDTATIPFSPPQL